MSSRRIRSKKHARRRKQTRRRRWSAYIICGVCLLALLVGLTHWSDIQIEEVTAATGNHIDSQLVVNLTNGVLEQPWLLGLVSRDNIALMPREGIRQEVHGISPRVKSVDISLTSLESVEIAVANRQPIARVCRLQAANSQGDCQVVDTEGFMFARAGESTAASSSANFRYLTDSEVSAGRQFLPTERFQALQSLVTALVDMEMYADHLIVGEHGDFIVPVSATKDADETDTVDLKMNLNKDLQQMVSNLQTVIENESFRPESSTTSTDSVSPFSLEYIDLRFDNKIFYK